MALGPCYIGATMAAGDVLRIDFGVDDTAESPKALLGRLGGAKLPENHPVTLDLSACGYLGPLATATLAALQLSRAAESRLRLIPPEHESLRAYCRYAGLLALFGAGPGPTAHPDNVTTPVRAFTSRPQSEMDEVVELVRRTMSWPESATTRLLVALAEVADNVLYHAESPIGGVISARAFKGKKEVRFAIADRGIGFRAALKNGGIETEDDIDALKKAIQAGVSSRSSGHNLGQGLKILIDIVKLNRGSLLLASGHACFELKNGKRAFQRLTAPFPGSLALVRLKMGGTQPKKADGNVWD